MFCSTVTEGNDRIMRGAGGFTADGHSAAEPQPKEIQSQTEMESTVNNYQCQVESPLPCPRSDRTVRGSSGEH